MSDATTLRLGIFLAVLFIMALWESLAPRRRRVLPRARHWSGNLLLIMLDALLVRLLLPAGAVAIALWSETQQTGLLHWLHLAQTPAGIVLAVILLDLVIYLQHRVFHFFPILWRLHMVHHADRDLDVTSGLRFHPLEIILSMLIKYAAIIALGAPAMAVIMFEILLNGMAMFNHANIYLPPALDRQLRKLIVTPDMHRVHHSVIRHETNSNFGFNLSLWDRCFGSYTAQPRAGHEGMCIGLTQYQQAPTHRIGWMLRLPFTGNPGQYPGQQSGQGAHDER